MSLAIKYSREYDDYLSFKRKVNFLCVLALVIAFVFFVGMPTSYAGKVKDFFEDQSIEGVSDIIMFSLEAPMYTICGILTGRNFSTGVADDGTKALKNFFQSITGKEESNYSFASAKFYNDFLTFMNTLKGIAAFLLIIIAAARIFSNMEKGMEGTQAVMKFLMEIGIAGVFIIYTDKILGAIAGVGVEVAKSLFHYDDFTKYATKFDNLADAIAVSLCRPKAMKIFIEGGKIGNITIPAFNGNYQSFGDYYATLDPNRALIKHDNTLGQLMLGTLKTLPSLLVGVASFVASSLACIQVLLEIAIRRIFAPVAVVDIYQEGLRSPGARYIKKFLATFFKLMIIAVVGLTIPFIQESIGGLAAQNTMMYMLLSMAIAFSGIGMMFKGGEIANDIVGA